MIEYNKKEQFWLLSKIFGPAAMQNAPSNQHGETTLQHFISRKSYQFNLKLGQVDKYIILCKLKREFFNLSDGCYGNPENTVVIATNQKNK